MQRGRQPRGDLRHLPAHHLRAQVSAGADGAPARGARRGGAGCGGARGALRTIGAILTPFHGLTPVTISSSEHANDLRARARARSREGHGRGGAGQGGAGRGGRAPGVGLGGDAAEGLGVERLWGHVVERALHV